MWASKNQTRQTAVIRAQIPPAQWTQTSIDRSKGERVVPMKVLCMGWPRTGSQSTATALCMLGFDDVYHFACVLENPIDADIWKRAIDAKWNGKGTFTKENWDALLGHCQAVTDFPASAFPDELIAAYPDAKVVLTIRPTDKWYKSVSTTVFRDIEEGKLPLHMRVMKWLLGNFGPTTKYIFNLTTPLTSAITNNNVTPAGLREAYEKHNAHVQAIVPPENLLIWGPWDGWEPLCKFLDVPIPSFPLPFVNESESFKKNIDELLMKDMKTIARKSILGLGLAIGLGMFAYKNTDVLKGYWVMLSRMLL